ncbi:MAG: hypothetical protein BGO78_10015 [Chloroflexi bacterium 44-23]|nr:MAG: hypothetical protein BGO78_10015 [Chloroflexi bacterium 44-23]
MSTETPTPASTWDQIKSDSRRLLSSLETLLDQTASSLSKLALVTLDEEERQKINQLVESNLVANQREAIRLMVQEGIRARSDIFSHVEDTRSQIDSIKEDLKMKFASKQVE